MGGDEDSCAAAAIAWGGCPSKQRLVVSAHRAGTQAICTIAGVLLGKIANANANAKTQQLPTPPKHPTQVPTSLQRVLPFKSKPKLEPKRKRPTLEQRRAVVLEPAERKQVTLLQQLNTIRNRKAEARRAAVRGCHKGVIV